jgi:inner membrane protein
MDNLSHTLVGIIAGEAIARSTKASPGGMPEARRRSLFVTVAAIGSNLPDVDLLWTMRGITGDPLSYLVHHRGHTHTVLGCIGLALLLLAAAMLWMRLRCLAATRRDVALLGGVAALGPLLHLGMDFLNSYGIHPFWPFDNRWYYGDAVFIIEPLYWLVAVPLVFVLRTPAARVVLALVVLAALLLTVSLQPAEPLRYGFVTALALLGGLVGWRASPRTSALVAAAAAVSLTGVFLAASQVARARVAVVAAAGFPMAATHDIVLTPSPTNPACWDLWLLQTEGGRYIARQGRLSLSAAAGAERCPAVQLGTGGTATLAAVDGAAAAAALGSGLRWRGEFSMPVARLASLVAADCRARRLMSFARAPFAQQQDGHWIIGDLRFDREPGVGFAEMESRDDGARGDCAAAPWQAPRADLLAARYR